MKSPFGVIFALLVTAVAYAQPTAPGGLAASTLSTSSVLLNWTDNSSNEIGFQVERSTSAGSGFALIATTAANITSYISTALTPGTQYFYRIRSTGTGGQSVYTTTSSATTGLRRFLLDFGSSTTQTTSTGWNNITVPTTGSVKNLIDASGATSPLTFTIVKDPSNAYGDASNNGAPQTVLDYPQSAASDGHYGWKTGGSYRLNGLDNGKTYSIRIFSSRLYVGDARVGVFTINGQQLSLEAANNTSKTIQFTNLTPSNGTINISFTLGSGVAFAYINVMDIVESSNVPQAPTGLAATASTAGQINLSWNDISSGETGFQVERSLTSGSDFSLINTSAANATGYVDFNLLPNTKYFYRIRAVNTLGNSPYTTEANVTTLPLPPHAPSDFTATAISPNQVHLGWNDSSDNETGFRIERSITEGSGYTQVASTAANIVAYADNNLNENTQYFYRIRSANTGGYSDYVSTHTTTLISIPATPTSLQATALSASSIGLTWMDAANNETGFEIERQGTSGLLVISVGPNTTSYTDEGLATGTSYSYRVRSINSAGNSGYSNEITSTTLVPKPIAPDSLTAMALSSKRIDLTWKDRSTDETGFRIERSMSSSTGFSVVATTGANVISYSDSTLSPLVHYYYRVGAINAGGSSTFTNEATALTLDAPPASPTSAGAVAQSATIIKLTWTDASTNETGFEIERSLTATQGFTVVATTNANTTTYSDNSLEPNTKYFYRIRSINSVGTSAFSNEATATTLPLPPVIPSNVIAIATSSSEIMLTWSDSSDNETGFQVERSTSTGTGFAQIATPSANTTAFTNNGLTQNTMYFYRVRAVNAGGNSPWSGEANTTTLVAPPTAPTALAGSAKSTTQIDLSWTDASSTETGFVLERSLNASTGFVVIDTLAANTNTFSNNNLSASTQYFYKLKSINQAGSSAYSSTIGVATQSLTQPYGTIFSETEFSSASRFPIVGTGITRGANKLTTTGNPTLFSSYVLHDDAANPFRYTCLENWKIRARVKTPSTLNSSSYGIGLGVRSSNAFDPYSTAMRWSWDAGANFVYLYYKTSISMQMVSTSKYVPAVNTYYWIEVTRNKDAFTYKIFDGATGTTQLFSVTLTFPTFTAGNYIKAHNTGQFALYQFGGTNEITNWEVSTTALKNADFAAIGDSNMHGMFASNNSQRWVENAMTASGKTFNIFAGISDRTSDVLQRLPEVIALKPKAVVLSIGRNDLANSVSLSTVQSNITNIINTLEGAGITVKLAGVIASNMSLSSLQNFYNGKPNQQVNAYTATKASSSTGMNTSYSSGDLIHLNAAGNTMLSNLLQTILGPVIPPTPTLPAAPSSLGATAVSASQINLTWTDGSSNETTFVVERSIASGSGFAMVATLGANVTAWSDLGLTNSTKYFYRVKATNSVGSSAYTGEVNATTSANASDPTALSASTLSTSSLLLSWADNATNETGFQVERSTSAASGFALVGTTSANTTTYISAALSSGTKYFYRVRAVNAGGNSGYSAVVSATTGVRRFLLDFGAPTVQTSTTGWNNITAPTTGSVKNLVDATGTTSGLTFTIVKDPSNGYAANNTNGPTQTILDYPSSAVSDSHFGWQSGGSYRINGLDNSKVYHIRIFSSRLFVSDSRKGTFTINGQQLSLEAAGNTSQTVQFTNLAPSSGALTINLTVAAGAGFAYINVMDVVEATPTAPARKAADETIAVEEPVVMDGTIEVSPNPVKTELTVFVQSESQQSAGIQIFDLVGRELYRIDGESNRNHLFDVRSLSQGMYLIRITTAEKTYTRSFLKQD